MLPRFRPLLSLADLFSTETCSIEVLEETFKTQLGYSFAVYFPYARTAVRAYLECLSDKGSEVVYSPYNCTALGQAVKAAGKTPLYVDTGPDFNPDVVQFKAALASPKVACGIATSLWGTDLDPDFFKDLRKPVLYDYALRGFSKDCPTLGPKDAVVYSLGWGKPMTSLRGGMLCTNSRAQAIQWRDWRASFSGGEHPWRAIFEALALYLGSREWVFGLTLLVMKLFDFRSGISATDSDAGDMFSYPGDWAYALGVRQLNDRERLRAERALAVQRYHMALSRLGEAIKLPVGNYLSHYPVRLTERDSLHEQLLKQGIFTSHRLFGKLLSDYPAFKGRCWREPVNARKLVENTLHLPLFTGLTEAQQKRVVEGITRALGPSRHDRSVVLNNAQCPLTPSSSPISTAP